MVSSSAIDLLIINPRIMWFSHKSSISNGPLTLASYLDGKGFKVRVLEDNAMYRKYRTDDFADCINRYQAKYLGFSVSALNAYNAYSLAGELRKIFPDKIFVAGGIHSFDSSEEMSKHDFDIIFKGEAELAVERFLRIALAQSCAIRPGALKDKTFIDSLKEIPGIIIKSGGERVNTGPGDIIRDLDELPFNNFDLVNLGDYIKSKYDHHAVTNQILFQRGCPYRCTFCKSSVISSQIRNNSAQYMIRQLENRYESFKLDNFFLIDSNFTLDKSRLKEFCRLMVSSGLYKKVKLMIQSSIAIPLSDDELNMLKDSGVTMFLLGIERFHDEARGLISKAGSQAQAVDLIKRLHGIGIKSIVNILINFPFETEESIKKEMDSIDKNISYIDFIYINYLMPMPGTSIHINDLAGSFAEWYLRREIVEYRFSYYDLAYLVEGPVALKMNFFILPRKVLNRMKAFKDKYQWKGSLRIADSAFLKILITADLVLGRISYYVADRFPKLEDFIFGPFKFLRLRGYKLFFNLFLTRRK